MCVCVSLVVTDEEVEETKKKMSVVAHLLTFVEEAASLDSRRRGRKRMLARE